MNRAIQLDSPFYVTVTGEAMLDETVADGLANKVALSMDDYQVKNISLAFHVAGDRVEYVFSCDAEFYIFMFGNRYPTITQHIELNGIPQHEILKIS